MKMVFNMLFVVFGYKNLHDFLDTTFLKGMVKGTILVSMFASFISVYFEEFLGMTPIVYFSLVILFILEFITGVSASIWIKKEKFSSIKMGRIILKIAVYSMILGLLNVFNHKIGLYKILFFQFNFFEWIYYVILNILILQLLVSVFENCETLGFKEVSFFLKIFKKKVKSIEEKAEEDIDKIA